MTADEKVARQKLSVLELAQALGNVTEACKIKGVSRTQFYEYKRRFQTHGLEGLKDLPPIHKTHPFTTPPEEVERLLAVSLEHPTWGCVKLSSMLKLEGITISSPTIQNILIKHGMASRYERLLKLEEKASQHAIELTPEQVAQIEKANPCFRERHVESSKPGELLSQDTFYVGVLKGVGRVYLHAVVDTYGSYAFGFLHTSKQPEAAVAVLHNDALPFYKDRGLEVKAVITDNAVSSVEKKHIPTNSTYHSTTLSIERPKYDTLRPMGLWNVLTGQFWMNSSEQPFVPSSMNLLNHFKKTLINGWSITTQNGPTKVIAIWVAVLWIQSICL